MPAWISIDERLPRHDLPVMLWGDKLETGLDHPLPGRLCGCHDSWLIEDYTTGYNDAEREHRGDPETDQEEYVRRMLGNVTHWLEWEPGPEVEELDSGLIRTLSLFALLVYALAGGASIVWVVLCAVAWFVSAVAESPNDWWY